MLNHRATPCFNYLAANYSNCCESFVNDEAKGQIQTGLDEDRMLVLVVQVLIGFQFRGTVLVCGMDDLQQHGRSWVRCHAASFSKTNGRSRDRLRHQPGSSRHGSLIQL